MNTDTLVIVVRRRYTHMNTSEYTIHNNGTDIVSTDYWSTPHAHVGKIVVSVHAGAFRVLVPDPRILLAARLLDVVGCAVTRGPCPEMELRDAVEILFDDASPSPYAIHLSVQAFDCLPARKAVGKLATLTVWVPGPSWSSDPRSRSTTIKCFEAPCRYRIAARLPDLRPWSDA